jgi:hypothetical protein
MRIIPAACVAVAAVIAAVVGGGCGQAYAPLRMAELSRPLEAVASVAKSAPAADKAGPAAQAPAEMSILEAPALPPEVTVDPRKVIYTATMAVQVTNVGAAVENARRLTDRLGGYIDHLARTGLTIRIPAARFDEAIIALSEMGSVTNKEIKGRDVTEEYVDLQVRLKSAKAVLEELKGLLAKSQHVKDALEVEREIARVGTEIEQIESTLARLANQVGYSTISVEFSPAPSRPVAARTQLPFRWLDTLGLDTLLGIVRR